MTWEEAEELMNSGTPVRRASWSPCNYIYKDCGRIYVSWLCDQVAWLFGDDDKAATDWEEYIPTVCAPEYDKGVLVAKNYMTTDSPPVLVKRVVVPPEKQKKNKQE